MIALRDGLPLVRYETGEVVAFRREWLLRSLAFAARRAGFEDLSIAEHVAEGVTAYLRDHFQENVMPLARLETAVRSTLEAIGYDAVASAFESEPPFAHIELPEIAAEAGCGYELVFFELLARDLGDALAKGRNFIELGGLTTCAKMLRAKKNWSPSCAILRDEIVAFARHRIEVSQPERDIVFTLT